MSEVIDRSVWNNLMILFDNDVEEMQFVIDDYYEETEGLLMEARLGQESGDDKAVYRAVHTIVSSSANVGATKLADLAKALDRDLKAGDKSSVDQMLPQLDAAYAEAKVEIGRLLADAA
ncbi:MAG TPA: Hpt domain-containing protein [Anaerolineae bacterium]|nr:Hpt domain-containing protein [Anaerolineae bacterium]